MSEARELRRNPRELRELAAFLRETYPVYWAFGPVTKDQRQSVNDAAEVLEILADEQSS